MSMEPIYRALIPAIWAIWGVYWFIAARGAKTTVRVESAASLASHLVPLVLGGWLIATNRPLGILGDKILPPGPWTYLGGVAVLIAGLAFSVWARRWLGRNWSGVVTLKQDHELIRGGPYRYLRHPIYSGILLAFAGCALARDEWRGVPALAIGWFALWRKLRLEERWLIEQFGAAYIRYRTEVPALIPNPFRRAEAQSS